MLYPHCWGNCNNRGIQIINSDEDDDGEPLLPDDLVEASLSLHVEEDTVIELDINTQVKEYVQHSVPVMIQMKVHDRRAMGNPFSDGYSLEGGMQYNA
ncbi:hypothetical protein AVEN_60666-1 [Araneus ventricosus]|uniref:Uncharacterized protein n=1 Tax=Araneus ventricosus TaxID=182803 RepID=A0A4Y2H2K1_ARAVE|nr:hypothetical protein AVEN_60666-1 [Araneus ventricosus]